MNNTSYSRTSEGIQDGHEYIPYELVDENQQPIAPKLEEDVIETVEVVEEPQPELPPGISQLIRSLSRVLIAYSIYLLKKKTDDLRDDLQRQQHFRSLRRTMQAERQNEYWRRGITRPPTSTTSKKKVTVTVEIED